MKSLVLIFSLALLVTGCSSPSSPVEAEPSASHTSGRELLAIGGAAAAGAAIGNEISGEEGALIGAGVGLLAGAAANNIAGERTAQREAELMEAARRDERTRIMNEYWEAQRYSPNSSSMGGEGSSEAQIAYPGGYYEGVNMAPRIAPEASPLTEPVRP